MLTIPARDLLTAGVTGEILESLFGAWVRSWGATLTTRRIAVLHAVIFPFNQGVVRDGMERPILMRT